MNLLNRAFDWIDVVDLAQQVSALAVRNNQNALATVLSSAAGKDHYCIINDDADVPLLGVVHRGTSLDTHLPRARTTL